MIKSNVEIFIGHPSSSIRKLVRMCVRFDRNTSGLLISAACRRNVWWAYIKESTPTFFFEHANINTWFGYSTIRHCSYTILLLLLLISYGRGIVLVVAVKI